MGKSQKTGLVRKGELKPEKKVAPCSAILPDGILEIVETIIPESCVQAAKGRTKGAPSLYTPRHVRTLLQNIVRGLPLTAAATVSGMSPGTVQKYQKLHPDFVMSLSRARELSQHHLMAKVEAGFDRHPKLALDVLERRHPKDWAPVKNINSNVLQATIQLEPDRLASMQGRSDCVSDVQTLIEMGKRSESTSSEGSDIIEAELAPESEDKGLDGEGI